MDLKFSKRTATLLFFDVVATLAAYWLGSFLTRVNDEVFVDNEIFFVVGVLAVFNIAFLALFRSYNNLWEYASIDELIRILVSLALSTLVGAVFLWVIGTRLPIRVYVVAFILLVLFCGGIRLWYRIFRSKGRQITSTSTNRPRTLVVGAGETGSLAINRMISRDPNMPGLPIVATDDDKEKRGNHIHGVRVEGGSEDIPELCEKYGIEQIVVAIPSATAEQRREIYSICTQTNCILKTLPNVRDMRIDELDGVALRDVDVTDLLGRDEILLDTRIASGYISGNTVLVTGGGGSIGSELCRQIAKVAPRRIVVFDMYENDAYMLCQELLRQYNDIDVIVEIGNVCDVARVNEIFTKYHPSVVFHAAAHKHVPLMEICPREAVQNNVFGTLNVVRAADEFNVSRFIFISTDKAVNPTSVMGATKRMGEMVMQYYARTSKTTFAAVRFGNVLGSNGSVIPLFKRQIASGGPVTVTHPDIERFFMTIPEASRLVITAGGMARGGEILILDMGEPVKILDLAKKMINLSGFEVGKDIEIKITGLRPGEKLYEELLMSEDGLDETENGKIHVGRPGQVDADMLFTVLDELKGIAFDNKTDPAVIEKMLEEKLCKLIPTFRHNKG